MGLLNHYVPCFGSVQPSEKEQVADHQEQTCVLELVLRCACALDTTCERGCQHLHERPNLGPRAAHFVIGRHVRRARVRGLR
jgi:hypothetical protein